MFTIAGNHQNQRQKTRIPKNQRRRTPCQNKSTWILKLYYWSKTFGRMSNLATCPNAKPSTQESSSLKIRTNQANVVLSVLVQKIEKICLASTMDRSGEGRRARQLRISEAETVPWLAQTERDARVGTIRKTTDGHHQLALALTHHGVREKRKKLQEEKSVKNTSSSIIRKMPQKTHRKQSENL